MANERETMRNPFAKHETVSNKLPKTKKHTMRKILKWSGLSSLVVIAGLMLYSMIFIQNHLKTLPEVSTQQLNTYGPTKIVDSAGNVIYQSPSKRYTEIKYDQIPELYKDGLIATEDKTFWKNKGISLKSQVIMIAGTIYSKINKSYQPRGGSTITQQLIKNKFFNGGQGIDTVTRKIQEIYLSGQFIDKFSKKIF